MATSSTQLRSVQPVFSSKPAPARTAVLASADLSFRQRVKETLTGLHWKVREAAGGAEAMAHLDAAPAEAVILDSWLPDLEVREFIAEFEKLYPSVDLVTVDGVSATTTVPCTPAAFATAGYTGGAPESFMVEAIAGSTTAG